MKREASCNKKLVTVSSHVAREQGVEVDFANFSELVTDNYDPDKQDSSGFPSAVTDFVARLSSSSGLIMSIPEYNYSLPGTLKNLMDWVSRVNPMPWRGCPILLMSASPSLVGGNRGLWSARIPLEACGGFVYPDMFSLASAYSAFDDNGKLKDEIVMGRLSKTITDFIAYVTKINQL
jgi:chromate reductase